MSLIYLCLDLHNPGRIAFLCPSKGFGEIYTVLFRALQDMYGSKHCVKPPYRNFAGALTMNVPHWHAVVVKSGL